MDKKQKKRMEVLQQKIAKLQQLLAGARRQPDGPAEVPRLGKELAAAHAELHALKEGRFAFGYVRCAPIPNRRAHEVTMESATLTSLASHGRRRIGVRHSLWHLAFFIRSD